LTPKEPANSFPIPLSEDKDPLVSPETKTEKGPAKATPIPSNNVILQVPPVSPKQKLSKASPEPLIGSSRATIAVTEDVPQKKENYNSKENRERLFRI